MPREINLKIRRGTSSDWSSVNPTLSAGEMALETDTRRVKVGDGSTAWNSLRYMGFDGGDIDPVTSEVATATGSNVRVEAFAQTGTIIGVALDFDEISGSGTTTVTKVASGEPTLPANFSLSNSLGSYSITTTATFTGNVLVSFVLPSSVTQQVFDTVRIFKLTSGVTTDVTVLDGPYAPDYSTRTIWASVDGFSEFYLIPWSFAPTATPEPTPTATPEPQFNFLGGSFTVTDPGLSFISRAGRLNSDGTLDNTFSIGTGFNSGVTGFAIQGDGKILVGGNFTSYNGTSTNRIARLNSDGTLDANFSIGTGFNGSVDSIAVQDDGKILIGGFFTSYNGTSRNRIARLNSDGTLDNTFSIGTGFNSGVTGFAIQGDGKILVGGNFTSYNGTSTNRIARLNNDGTLDNTFSIGTGFNSGVTGFAIQGDGKILVGGNFTSYNGASTNRIARLNNDGTLDNTFSIGTGFNEGVRSIVIQGDGKTLVGGWFTSYNGTSTNRIVRLNSDGTLDNTFSIGTGFDGYVNSVVIQGDGKILVGGWFVSYNGTSRSRIARLNSDGTLDNTFSIGTGFDGDVNSIVVQNDGKILVGGWFTSYNGTSSNFIARLNSDGALDNTFSIGTGFSNIVNSIVVQNDGKILVGGWFTSYNGTSSNRIARLNSDGALDNTFSIGTGFSNTVNSIVVQNDGKILVGGAFVSYNGTSSNFIARLNSDGSLDNNFSIGTGFNSTVNSVVVQNDGKILVGGNFTSYNGTSTNRIARLNSDGTLDANFNIGTGLDSNVYSFAIQGDGKILVGGWFASYNGNSSNFIARLNSDGTLDDNFNIGTGFNSAVYSVAIQNDGKILVGGAFASYNGTSTNRIARLNSDGTLDANFNIGTGLDSNVYSFAIQGDGKILVGGWFTSYNGISRSRIARLNSDGTLDANFDFDVNGNVNVVL